ncbi:hypothetical protein PMIN06_011384 [Paraphaeosphaeria minitans]
MLVADHGQQKAPVSVSVSVSSSSSSSLARSLSPSEPPNVTLRWPATAAGRNSQHSTVRQSYVWTQDKTDVPRSCLADCYTVYVHTATSRKPKLPPRHTRFLTLCTLSTTPA